MNVEIARYAYSGGYLLALIVPFVACGTIKLGGNGVGRAFIVVVVSSAVMSGVVILGWKILDLALADHLAVLDRDGDSFWTEEEQRSWSESDWAYYHLAMADGGRNVFSTFVFPIFSFLYSAAIVGSFALYGRLRNKNA